MNTKHRSVRAPEKVTVVPPKATASHHTTTTVVATGSHPSLFARDGAITLVVLGLLLLYAVIPWSKRWFHRVDTARHATRAAFLILISGLILLLLYGIADILWAFRAPHPR